jgi:hypothetical protein
MNRPEKGRGLFYTRDSGGKHENTPGEYVAWAQRRSQELGIAFAGTPAAIDEMIRSGVVVSGDLFLDSDVQGHRLTRNGLNALMQEISRDKSVSHVLIPRRDRLARPNHAIDAVKLEDEFLSQGVSLVFMDRFVAARPKGRRTDISNMIMAVVDYDRAGKDRRDLAEKILFAQLNLAKQGFSTGGRPPFGFRRWLVDGNGTPVRELSAGERVRMPHHHVVWLPGPECELQLIRRILSMLESMPASRVAAILTREGIPSPDSGRLRRDNGISHPVSGVWHATTINNIARNPLLCAITQYGRRSMGDQLRYTPKGPRELAENDYRLKETPKVIRNPESEFLTAAAGFEPLVDIEKHQTLIAKLDKRAGTQRGKPRARNAAENPLGGRVFDMGCTWPMYRQPHNGSFRYTCGLYQQSHGAQCDHNHVSGPLAAQFALSCIRQRILSPKLMAKLKARLRELAEGQRETSAIDCERNHKRAELQQIQKDVERAARNMTVAESESVLHAMTKVFNKLEEREVALKAEIAKLETHVNFVHNVDAEVISALRLAEQLVEFVADDKAAERADELIRLANVKLFFQFVPVQSGKRTLNKIESGVVTFGSASPPVNVYGGRTDRATVKGNASRGAEAGRIPPQPNGVLSGREDTSLGNANRGDWI